MDQSKDNNEDAPQNNQNGAERMEIEDEEPACNMENYFPNLLSHVANMDIENIQPMNLRLNKFCNASQVFGFTQTKTHSGLPSDLNKIYYKKASNPSFFS